jgi:hypothetical protein
MYEKEDRLKTPEAIGYLKEKGFPLSYHTILNLSSQGRIPRRKFGRELIFSKIELAKWIEKRMLAKEVSC